VHIIGKNMVKEEKKQEIINQIIAPILNMPANCTAGQLMGAIQTTANNIAALEKQGVITFSEVK